MNIFSPTRFSLATFFLLVSVSNEVLGVSMNYIKRFEDISISDIPAVGGKNASLGQMIQGLTAQGILIPTGFAVTADAYWYFIKSNNLLSKMQQLMDTLKDPSDLKQLTFVGSSIRSLILNGVIPKDLEQEIVTAYKNLSDYYKQNNCDVAVRSSATAEDLPTASFAGQQETFLNIHGEKELLESYKKCLASLFTDRAIVYRIDQKIAPFDVALSVGIQKMIRSDLATSGVAFSLDTESGFKDVVVIHAAYGLGESIVQGIVTPDEFVVHKPTLLKGFPSLIKKQLGEKDTKIIYTDNVENPVQTIKVTQSEIERFSLSDQEVLELARIVSTIEEYYSKLNNAWTPMDVEWAKDGKDQQLYVVQARPETIHAQNSHANILHLYHLAKDVDLKSAFIISGQSVGQQIVSGVARVVANVKDINQIQKGDILVTSMTDPDWVPAMKKVAGIITDKGGRTCHAAIVSRELKIPAIVGTENATAMIKTGQTITLDCSQGSVGNVYAGMLSFTVEKIALNNLPTLSTAIYVNIADPDAAFAASMLPTQGVGLVRMEFIINNAIKIHPMALVQPDKIKDPKIQKQIEQLTKGYTNKTDFFVDTLARSISMIAAAFYPRPVIVRLSDFKTNEYRNLIGGIYFEPEEENPMIGWRGASRYYNPNYRDAFALECKALKKVRDEMGLTNVKIMVPFVRTAIEGQKVIDEMVKHGLVKGANGLELVMMCEIPSNVIVIDDFCKIFDGFSIGSNDLTQLTLGVDRDSGLLTKDFDERDPAVLKMLKLAIEGAHRNKKYIGICGQAPSDYPEIADYLMQCGIDSLSLNADTVIPFMLRLGEKK